MRVFCLYGVGKATERAYHFHTPEQVSTSTIDSAAGADIEAAIESNLSSDAATVPTTVAAASLASLTPASVIANYISNATTHVYAGVQMGDGTTQLVCSAVSCAAR